MSLVRGIDHVAFGSGSLDAAVPVFTSLGLSLTPRGRAAWKIGGRTAEAGSRSAMFAETYLDVIETPGERWEGHLTRHTLAAGSLGPSGIVLGTASLGPTLEALRAGGLGHAEPYQIERTIACAGETLRMRYRIAALPALAHYGPPTLVIEDCAPQAMRTPVWLAHPNGATALARVSVFSPEPDAWADFAALLFGDDAVKSLPGGLLCDTGTAELALWREPPQAPLRALVAAAPSRERPFFLALHFTARESRWVDPASGPGCAVELR